MLLSVVLAQAATSTGNDPINQLYGLGVGGVFIVLVLIGVLWPKPAVDRLDKVIASKDKEIEAWKHTYEIERDAHISLQQDRSAQVEHYRFIEKLFDELRDSAKARS